MKPLLDLVREIHRRSLWQVLGIYGVASWGVIQVVDTLASVLPLPDWLPSVAFVLLVVGLPVVLATAFVQEGGPGLVGDREPEVEEERAGSGKTGARRVSSARLRQWLTWRHALIAGTVAFAAWGVFASAWLLVAGYGMLPGGAGVAGEPRSGIGEAAGLARYRSLAVLPLDNFTGDPAQEYIVSGLHEALVSELAKLGALTVKSRTSVQRFTGSDLSLPEIAAELGGVDAVLEGSLFQAGDSLRLTVQLIDARTDDHVWAESYWGTLGGILHLQRRVARAIASEIEVTLSPHEEERLSAGRMLDPEAVREYLRGRADFSAGLSPAGLRRSIDRYREALEIEPGYALAWAGLADSYLVFAHTGMPSHEAFPRAEEAARRALELDGDLAEAHTALADVLFHYHWDWEGSERAFRRAIALRPGYAVAHWWYSGLLAALGRMDESVVLITRARELDPLSPISHGFAVRIFYYARDFESSLSTAARIRDMVVHGAMDPPWSALSHHALGRSDEALGILDRAVARGGSPYERMARIEILADLGDLGRARENLEALEEAYRREEHHLPHLLAVGRAAVGDPDRALEWLERAAEDRDGALPWLTVEPAFDGLRSEARFQALLERMGLDEVETPGHRAGT